MDQTNSARNFNPNQKRTYLNFDIRQDKFGNPYLKRLDYPRSPKEPRGLWVEFGKVGDHGLNHVYDRNADSGYLMLPDDEGNYRILILTE